MMRIAALGKLRQRGGFVIKGMKSFIRLQHSHHHHHHHHHCSAAARRQAITCPSSSSRVSRLCVDASSQAIRQSIIRQRRFFSQKPPQGSSPPSSAPLTPTPPQTNAAATLEYHAFLLRGRFGDLLLLLTALCMIDITFNDGATLQPAFHYLMDHCGMPLLRLLDPEQAHDVAIWGLKHGLVPRNDHEADDPILAINLWGLQFPNPVGLAAGFDKHAEAMEGLFGLGLGFVEIGSVTPQPQEGNPKPRMFRLLEDRGVINRYGFNSHGLDQVQARLEEFWKSRALRTKRGLADKRLLGVNIGKNKLTEKAEDDYILGVKGLCMWADYLVINVSSPNTPGLRTLQKRGQMEALIKAVKNQMSPMNVAGKRVPLLIKIAPDLTDEEKKDIAEVAKRTKIDGLIVSNTTITRPETLQSANKGETGGLSGAPLKELSTNTIRDIYTLTQGKIPIVGVGGIGSGQDAYEKIRAGASVVQVYSMLVYEGPGSIKRIKQELIECLKRDGFSRLEDAIGATRAPNEKHVLAVTTK